MYGKDFLRVKQLISIIECYVAVEYNICVGVDVMVG